MATLIQFLAGQPIKPVVVIGGKSERLRHIALTALLDRIRFQKLPRADTYREYSVDVESFDAPETPARTVLTRLAQSPSFYEREVVVYRDVQEADDLEPFQKYMANPTPNVYAVLVANDVRRKVDSDSPGGKEKERWIPSDKRVLYIDCNPLEPANLVKLCVLNGTRAQDAEALVERLRGDLDSVCRVLDLAEVFEKRPPGVELELCQPEPSDAAFFARYGVLNADTDTSLCRQLRRRLAQMVSIALTTNEDMTLMERANRCDVEPFMLMRLGGLARQATPSQWMQHLCDVVRVEPYARDEGAGVREYLRLTLR